MSRRPRNRNRTHTRPTPQPHTRRRPAIAAVAAVSLVILALALLRLAGAPERRRHDAEAAEALADWPRAAEAWLAYHAGGPTRGDGSTRVREARAALQANRPSQAQAALDAAIQIAPRDPRPWLLRLEMLRLEDRPLDAQRLGWAAHAAVPPASQRRILIGLTLALLSAVPEPEARSTLDAWTRSDPACLDAELARLRLIASDPHPGDPTRAQRITRLTTLLAHQPNHPGLRERLIDELADAGEPALGRTALDAWPQPDRDARYDRQLGRWLLEFDHQPEAAVAPLTRALEALPFDAPTRYRLARALQQSGHEPEARAQVAALHRLREATEPAAIEPRLAAAAADRANTPQTARDMAALSDAVGLTRLANAWRAEASRPAPATP
jgi:tetratricopeptide (TPR) repeat protein